MIYIIQEPNEDRERNSQDVILITKYEYDNGGYPTIKSLDHVGFAFSTDILKLLAPHIGQEIKILKMRLFDFVEVMKAEGYKFNGGT